MSNLLSQASLVMIPSGYKEDVVYSQIPTDGSGDLSFTRASNGTRINSAGLVEVAPWNLADQSNTFGTSPWSNVLDTGATLTYTANYGTAPDGTTTAGRLQMALNGSNYAQKNQIISVITGQQYTYSVWIKSLSGTKDVIFCYDNTNNIHATVTTEWQRFTHTFTGNSQVYARFVLEAGTSTSVDLLIYGAQLNIGSTAKPYFPTTDRLNVPRLTYQNGGGGCPSLLLEKQSTNLVTYSEQFDDASWSLGNASITANATTSPDGTQNAEKLYTNTATSTHQIRKTISSVTAQNYTMSIFAKKGELNYIRFWEDGQTGKQCYFNLNTGVATNVDMTSASIENMGNGWYRCSAIVAIPASGVFGYRVLLTPDGTTTSFTGNGSDGVFLYGAQLEASSYATSYIPTTSSSATRVADACYKTGISSLIGQTEGVLFADVNLTTRQSFTYISISNGGSSANYIGIYFRAAAIEMEVVNGGVLQGNVQYSNTSTGRFKIAIGYKQNDFMLYVNGTQIGTDTSGTIPTCDRLDLFAFNDNQPLQVNETILFPTRLTNAELASLTTI